MASRRTGCIVTLTNTRNMLDLKRFEPGGSPRKDQVTSSWPGWHGPWRAGPTGSSPTPVSDVAQVVRAVVFRGNHRELRCGFHIETGIADLHFVDHFQSRFAVVQAPADRLGGSDGCRRTGIGDAGLLQRGQEARVVAELGPCGSAWAGAARPTMATRARRASSFFMISIPPSPAVLRVPGPEFDSRTALSGNVFDSAPTRPCQHGCRASEPQPRRASDSPMPLQRLVSRLIKCVAPAMCQPNCESEGTTLGLSPLDRCTAWMPGFFASCSSRLSRPSGSTL